MDLCCKPLIYLEKWNGQLRALCLQNLETLTSVVSHSLEVFFFNFIIYLSVLAAPCLHLCVRAFSSCTEWGLLSLWCTGSVIALLGLSCPEMCESSQTWGRNQIPAMAGRFLTTGPPWNLHTYFYVVCLIVSIFCCSVAKSCLTPCDPMDCSTPGFPVLHCLPEFAQTHVH